MGGCIIDSGRFNWLKHPEKFPSLAKPEEAYAGSRESNVACFVPDVNRGRIMCNRFFAGVGTLLHLRTGASTSMSVEYSRGHSRLCFSLRDKF